VIGVLLECWDMKAAWGCSCLACAVRANPTRFKVPMKAAVRIIDVEDFIACNSFNLDAVISL